MLRLLLFLFCLILLRCKLLLSLPSLEKYLYLEEHDTCQDSHPMDMYSSTVTVGLLFLAIDRRRPPLVQKFGIMVRLADF